MGVGDGAWASRRACAGAGSPLADGALELLADASLQHRLLHLELAFVAFDHDPALWCEGEVPGHEGELGNGSSKFLGGGAKFVPSGQQSTLEEKVGVGMGGVGEAGLVEGGGGDAAGERVDCAHETALAAIVHEAAAASHAEEGGE